MDDQPLHILVIEPDDSYRASLSAAIKALGCRVSDAGSADAALAAAPGDPPNGVIVSAEGPKLTGFVVCNRLKRVPALSTVPVVIVVGSTPESAVDDHREARTRADNYLPRATPFAELASEIQSLAVARLGAAPKAPAPAQAVQKPDPVEEKAAAERKLALELRLLDDEIERRRDEMEWVKVGTLLEEKLKKLSDTPAQIATLEALLTLHNNETINGPEAIRSAERLMRLVPDHDASVATLRRIYTRRKDTDRLAELDEHLARIKARKST